MTKALKFPENIDPKYASTTSKSFQINENLTYYGRSLVKDT